MTKLQKIKYFKSRVKHWAAWFSLSTWEIHVFAEEMEDTRAHYMAKMKGRIASVMWCPSWLEQGNPSRKEIDRVAFHEVAEVFLCQISADLDLYCGHSYSEEHIHRVIRLLENKILGEVE